MSFLNHSNDEWWKFERFSQTQLIFTAPRVRDDTESCTHRIEVITREKGRMTTVWHGVAHSIVDDRHRRMYRFVMVFTASFHGRDFISASLVVIMVIVAVTNNVRLFDLWCGYDGAVSHSISNCWFYNYRGEIFVYIITANINTPWDAFYEELRCACEVIW